MKLFSAQKLKHYIEEKCLKPSALASKAGIGSSTLSSIVHGQKIPNVNTLGRIAFILDKPVDFFYEDESIVMQARFQFSEVTSA
jgi:transcriptional regulator with XRE-family HTH domain